MMLKNIGATFVIGASLLFFPDVAPADAAQAGMVEVTDPALLKMLGEDEFQDSVIYTYADNYRFLLDGSSAQPLIASSASEADSVIAFGIDFVANGPSRFALEGEYRVLRNSISIDASGDKAYWARLPQIPVGKTVIGVEAWWGRAGGPSELALFVQQVCHNPGLKPGASGHYIDKTIYAVGGIRTFEPGQNPFSGDRYDANQSKFPVTEDCPFYVIFVDNGPTDPVRRSFVDMIRVSYE